MALLIGTLVCAAAFGPAFGAAAGGGVAAFSAFGAAAFAFGLAAAGATAVFGAALGAAGGAAALGARVAVGISPALVAGWGGSGWDNWLFDTVLLVSSLSGLVQDLLELGVLGWLGTWCQLFNDFLMDFFDSLLNIIVSGNSFLLIFTVLISLGLFFLFQSPALFIVLLLGCLLGGVLLIFFLDDSHQFLLLSGSLGFRGFFSFVFPAKLIGF